VAVWLYQMSAEGYSIEEYRAEVWEGEIVKWPTGSVRTDSGNKVAPGDVVILVFVRTGAKEPGICGWGIVTNYKDEKELFSFRPTHPSDYLKMNPIWDDDVSDLLNSIRGPMKQGTMWEMSGDQAKGMKKKIHGWMK